MKNRFFLLMLIAFFMTACAALPRHEHVVGDVLKADSQDLIVCLEGSSVQKGQKVAIFESECKRTSFQMRWAKIPTVSCVEQKVGEAEIVSTTNLHEVQMKLLNQSKVKTGNFVKL